MTLDNFRAQKIIWDRANKKIFEKIEANSGDSNGRKLVVQVINQEATEELSGTTLSLGWKSRNGAKGLDAFHVVDASKGIFEIYYTTEMLSNIGNIEASLILINSTSRIESSTFTISVRPSTVDDSSVQSENSFTALTEALVKVNDFDAQLAQTMSRVEFYSWVATLLDGGPSIFMDTLSELQTTYPKGTAGVALVRETNPAKIYVWNGTAWEDFGDYQGVEIKDDTISHNKYQDKSISPIKTDFIENAKIFSSIENNYSKYIISGSIVDDTYLFERESGRTLILPIEKGKTYKITKEVSDRFRVALSKSEPQSPLLLHQLKDNQTSSDSDTSFVFTNEEHNYVYIYVSASSKEPKTVMTEQNYLVNGNIEATNIVTGKNLFDGNYVRGYVLPGATGWKSDTGDNFGIILNIKPDTYYAISKSSSNRFIVMLTSKAVTPKSTFYFDGDDVYENHTGENEVIIRSGPSHKTLIVYVSSESTPPNFVQIEENEKSTSWESFGYKFQPHALPVKSETTGNNSYQLNVEDFRENGLSDYETIQRAFDAASGQIVYLDSGRVYNIEQGLNAQASKVLGIEGCRALLVLTGTDDVALTYEGNLRTGTAAPSESNSNLIRTESGSYIRDLRVISKEPYNNTGIKLKYLHKALISGNMLSELKNGIVVESRNRDMTFENNHIYNNSGDGILFDTVDIHQLLLQGGHMSYNKNGVRFVDGSLANILFDNASIENNITDGNPTPQSLISFEETTDGKPLYEVIIIDGCNLQDHRTNQRALLNFDVSNGSIHDLILANSLIGNASYNGISVYLKGVNGASVHNNSIVGYPNDISKNSIVLAGVNSNIKITDNRLAAPIDYNNSEITKMMIKDNLLEGFSIEDSNDGNILVKDNF